MSTEAQRNANRANARKSTGPRTAAGKATSSQNARIHGFSGRLNILPDDEALLYVQLSERYVRELQPVTLVEEELVKTIADCNWQLNRFRAIEEQIIREMCGAQLAQSGPVANLAIARAIRRDCEGPAGLDRLARYRAHFQRALHQSLNQLHRLKAARLTEERARPQPTTVPEPASAPPIGFVLQKQRFHRSNSQSQSSVPSVISARKESGSPTDCYPENSCKKASSRASAYSLH